MTLQEQIQQVLEENVSLKNQVEGFQTLTEQFLHDNFQLQKQISESEKKITDIEIDVIAQGQMQTDIELTQIEQGRKLTELETVIGGGTNA